MNPGNGIETNLAIHHAHKIRPFITMNPGNGIETLMGWGDSLRTEAFITMNPGNGIETDFNSKIACFN